MIFIAITLMLLIAIIVGQWFVIRELLIRLMAGSLREFKTVTTKEKLSEVYSMSDRNEYEHWCKENGKTPEKEDE